MSKSTRSLKCRACDNLVPVTIRGGPRGGPVRSGYYCSDDCKPRCPIKGCDRPIRKRGWCQNHYATWRDHGDPEAEVAYRWRPKPERIEEARTRGRRQGGSAEPARPRRVRLTARLGECLTCGTPSDSEHWTYSSRKFCTNVCKVTWGKYKGNVPVDYECVKCGAVTPYYDPETRKRRRSDSKYCPNCSRSYYFRFSPQDLADEDGTLCGICGEDVDMSLSYPDLMSASIDHIIPRALGGSDERGNARLAHFLCNCTRRHSLIE